MELLHLKAKPAAYTPPLSVYDAHHRLQTNEREGSCHSDGTFSEGNDKGKPLVVVLVLTAMNKGINPGINSELGKLPASPPAAASLNYRRLHIASR